MIVQFIGACTRTEPHQKLLGAFVPQPSKGAAVAPQLDANDDDGDDVDIQGFINTGASVNMYMPPVDEEPFRAQLVPLHARSA